MSTASYFWVVRPKYKLDLKKKKKRHYLTVSKISSKKKKIQEITPKILLAINLGTNITVIKCKQQWFVHIVRKEINQWKKIWHEIESNDFFFVIKNT